MKSDEPPLPNCQQIDTVLRFLPRLANSNAKHSHWHTEPGMLPWCELSQEVQEFRRALHDLNFVIGFNWGDWQEEALSYFNSAEKLASADLHTIRQLLTLHVRKDRFCEGHFAAMIENGHIAAILRRLAAIREEQHDGTPTPKPQTPTERNTDGS